MDLKEEAILGDYINEHWYYVSKGRAMQQFLGGIKANEVVDIGAGSGIFSRQLIDEGICDSAICVDPNYDLERLENHNGKQIKYVKNIRETSIKLALMMDVLEHVDDDVSLLRHYLDQMEAGGFVFISVPAFQFMWSSHDVFLEHHRRYTIKMIEDVTRKAGATPVKSSFFMASFFPLLAPMRLFKNFVLKRSSSFQPKSELKKYPEWINGALISIHDIERKTIFRFNKSFGLSVFCLCRKD